MSFIHQVLSTLITRFYKPCELLCGLTGKIMSIGAIVAKMSWKKPIIFFLPPLSGYKSMAGKIIGPRK